MVYSVLFQQDANNGMSVKEAGMFLHSPETNIAPENRPSQKETSIPTIHFQVRTVSFREGIFLFLGDIDSRVCLVFWGLSFPHSGPGVFGSMAKMLNKVDRSVGFEAWNWAKWFMVLLKDGRTRCGCQWLVDDADEENYIWCFILLLLLVIYYMHSSYSSCSAILVIIVVLIVILIVAILMMRVFVVIIVIRVITIIIVTIDIVAVIIFLTPHYHNSDV